jgi:hypothetical protein
MMPLTFRQIIYRLSIAGVVLGILANTYDILIGAFLEALHILFEVIEVILDNAVEHVFHTGVHQTQTIVFYLMVAIGILLIYYLSHAIVHCCRVLADTWRVYVDTYRSYKISAYLYWHELPLFRKAIWVTYAILMVVASLMFSGFM